MKSSVCLATPGIIFSILFTLPNYFMLETHHDHDPVLEVLDTNQTDLQVFQHWDTQTQLLIIRTLTGVSCLMTTWPWPMSPPARVWWRWWSEMRLPSEWWVTPWCQDFSLQSSGVTRPTLLWDILDNLSNISLYPGLCDVAPSSVQHHHSIHCSLIHEHEHLQETCLGRVDH